MTPSPGPIAGALLAIAACAPPAPGGTVTAPTTTVAPPVASAAPAPPPAASIPAPVPGDVVVTVLGLGTTDEGPAVLLGDASRKKVLPIMIGGTEALSIALRFERRRYERPLTHDLLDAVMHDLGGQLIRVRIDDMKDDTFLATIFVRHGDKVSSIDARPSDAIALALGSSAPIYVAPAVLERAGVDRDSVAPSADVDGGAEAGIVVP